MATYQANGNRIEFVTKLVSSWLGLRKKNVSEKRIGLILANYPNKDGRLANGVGLDTPASTIDLMKFLSKNGYSVSSIPKTSSDLMDKIVSGPTNWLTDRHKRQGGVRFSLQKYKEVFKTLSFEVRQLIKERWGEPESDPFIDENCFALSVISFGSDLFPFE